MADGLIYGGAALIVASAAWYDPRIGLLVAGVLCLSAGVLLSLMRARQ